MTPGRGQVLPSPGLTVLLCEMGELESRAICVPTVSRVWGLPESESGPRDILSPMWCVILSPMWSGGAEPGCGSLRFRGPVLHGAQHQLLEVISPHLTWLESDLCVRHSNALPYTICTTP